MSHILFLCCQSFVLDLPYAFQLHVKVFFKSPLYFFIWRSYSAPSSLGMYTENISDKRIFSSAQISINPFQILLDTQMLPIYIPEFDVRCLSYCYYNCSYYSHSSENSPDWVCFCLKLSGLGRTSEFKL